MSISALPRDNTSVIEYARGLLARAESGEVIAVTAVEELPGGLYRIEGSSTPNRLQTMGMLLDAAVTRSING